MSDGTTPDSPGEQFRGLLQSLEGEWEGISKTWFEPGKLVDESPLSGTFQPEMQVRFSLFEYHGTLCGDPLHGKLTIGYFDQRKRVETAWIDGFHMGNGILFSVGEANSHGFSVLGHYPVPDHPDWGWRTELIVEDPDHLTLRSYNITPEGEEYLGIESVLTRK